MEQIFPYGETSGDFVDADVANGIRGSKVPAQFFNEIQAEIIAAIEAAGLTPDGSNLTQLSEAIQGMASSGNADLSSYATTEYVDDQIDAIPNLGINQSWQNMTSQRSKGINYTNTTDNPIFISVTARVDSSGTLSLYLIIDGEQVSRDDRYNTPGGHHNNLTAIVPPGSVYRVEGSGGYIDNWRELR